MKQTYPLWKRLLLKAALRLPESIRFAFGLLSWKDLVKSSPEDYRYFSENHPHVKPAITLSKMGEPFPSSIKPWPKHIAESAQSWNDESNWVLSLQELKVWINLWGQHPEGQDHLTQTLACVCAAGQTTHVQALIQAGADINGYYDRTGSVLENLMSFKDCSQIVNMLSVVKQQGKDINWEQLIRQKDDHPSLFYKVKWNQAELINLEALDLNISPRIWSEIALNFVDDPKGYTPQIQHQFDALGWLLEPHRLGEEEQCRSLLIQNFLQTSRFGLDEDQQLSANIYWSILVPPQKGLPSLVNTSWGEIWLQGHFPEAIPNRIIEQILHHPSSKERLEKVQVAFDEKWESKKGSGLYPDHLERFVALNSQFQSHTLQLEAENFKPSGKLSPSTIRRL